MPTADRYAFIDESFREVSSGGSYVLAAATFAPANHDAARDAMREIRGRRRTGKLHWSELDEQQRRNAAKVVAGIEGFHVVAVGTPVPRRRQERARAKCLHRLVLELHNCGVTHLVVESRTRQLDLRDVRVVTAARLHLPKGSMVRVDHQAGAAEPLLWAADVIAGAVRAVRHGESGYLPLIAGRVYEIDVETGCG